MVPVHAAIWVCVLFLLTLKWSYVTFSATFRKKQGQFFEEWLKEYFKPWVKKKTKPPNLKSLRFLQILK